MVYNYLNKKYVSTARKTTMPDMCVPNQALSIPQLIAMSLTGVPVPGRVPEYELYDEDELDIIDSQNFRPVLHDEMETIDYIRHTEAQLRAESVRSDLNSSSKAAPQPSQMVAATPQSEPVPHPYPNESEG